MQRSLLVAALAVVMLAASIVQANEEVRPTLTQAAKIIKQLLDQRGSNAVTVGEFAGPPQFASATGAGMRKILVEELAKLDVRDKKLGATFGVKGQYAPPAEQGVMKIKISLVDAQGEPLTQLNADVETKEEPRKDDGGDLPPSLIDNLKTQVRKGEFDLTAFGSPVLLAETLGVTMPFSVERGFVPRTIETPQDVLKAFENPPAFVENGSQVRADRASPYFVQILVNDRPKTVTLEDGHPFVELGMGESFQIRLVDRPFDISAKFHLDGVNSYAFTEMRHEKGPEKGNPLYSRWIISTRTELILKGWHRTNQFVDKFLVTDFENSATAKVGNSSGQGTITVAIQSTWRLKDQKPPLEEQPERRPPTLGSAGPNIAGSAPPRRIGIGEKDVQQVQADANPRINGLPRAVIAIRYTRSEVKVGRFAESAGVLQLVRNYGRGDMQRFVVFAALVFLGFVLASPATANEALRPTFVHAAQIIKKLLTQQGAKDITVADFTGPPQFASGAGAGMRKILIEELAKLEVNHQTLGALYGVNGKFLPPADGGAGAMRLRMSLVDARGEVLTKLNVDVDSQAERDVPGAAGLLERLETKVREGEFDLTAFESPLVLAEALGVTMPFTVRSGFQAETREKTANVLASFAAPRAFIENGSQVRAARGSPYFVQILVNGQPRSATLERGHPFVALARGESFEIRVNEGPFDVMARFHLDGVNSYAFSDLRHESGSEKGNSLYTRWYLPRTELTLKGWHRTNEEVDKFLVTDFANSATAKVGNSNGQGIITVSFQSTWKKAGELPPLEERPPEIAVRGAPEPTAQAAPPPPGEATSPTIDRIGQGERAPQIVKPDPNARETGLPRAVIAIRYTRD